MPLCGDIDIGLKIGGLHGVCETSCSIDAEADIDGARTCITDSTAHAARSAHLVLLAHFLSPQTTEATLEEALTSRTMTSKVSDSIYKIPLKMQALSIRGPKEMLSAHALQISQPHMPPLQEASFSRDSLAKAIYAKVLASVSHSVSPLSPQPHSAAPRHLHLRFRRLQSSVLLLTHVA